LEARDEKRLLRLQRQLAGYKLLIIDELGYVPLSQTGAELLFEVFSQRYERGSTVVTSNLPFDEWTSVFGHLRLSQSGMPSRSALLAAKPGPRSYRRSDGVTSPVLRSRAEKRKGNARNAAINPCCKG